MEKGGRKKYTTEKNGRIVGGEGWQEKAHNREEWKNSWWRRVAGKSTYERNGRIVGGEGWQEKVHNREEWKNSWWRRVAGKSTYERNGRIVGGEGWQTHGWGGIFSWVVFKPCAFVTMK